MKFRSLFLISAVLGSSVLALNMAHANDLSEQEREVWNVILAWNDAFEKNDADNYFNYVDEEIVVLVPGNPYRVQGIGPDRAEFEYGIAGGRTKVYFFQELQPKIRLVGDVAIVTYYSRGSYGDSMEMTYLKETDVLIRDQSGKWKVAHIHVSK